MGTARHLPGAEVAAVDDRAQSPLPALLFRRFGGLRRSCGTGAAGVVAVDHVVEPLCGFRVACGIGFGVPAGGVGDQGKFLALGGIVTGTCDCGALDRERFQDLAES